MIPIHKEPIDITEKFDGVTEHCFFCKYRTLYWHENTNNPVCSKCAKEHKVSELPDYGQNIRANKRKNKKVLDKK